MAHGFADGRFAEDEAQAILREALHPAERRDEFGLELDEIVRTGAELGIPENRIREAAERVRAKRRESDLVAEYRRLMRVGFWAHAAPYVIVNAMMITFLFIGWIPGVALLGSLFGWGIGLAAHAVGTFNESSACYREGLREYAESKGTPTKAPSP